MIRVLLVDDELLSRMTIRSLIDWEKEGYTICGECSDGQQAWMSLPSLRPQIVITDVKMNRMNGDELVRRIAAQYPEICTIVFSGYDDYRYVRDVLKHKAVDYLIKNDLTREVLLESLHKAEKILETGPEIEKDENNLQALRRQFVLRLIGREYEGKEHMMEKEMQKLSIDLDIGRVLPVLLIIRNLEEKTENGAFCDRMIIIFSICNVLEEIIREEHRGMAVSLENNEILLLISFSGMVSEQRMGEALRKLINRGSFCLNKFMSLKANFHVGRLHPLKEIPSAFQEIEQRREKEFLDLHWEPDREAEEYNQGDGIRLADEQRLMSALRQGDEGGMDELLDAVFREIVESNILRSGCTKLFSDLVILSISYCKKQGIPYDKVYTHKMAVMEYVTRIEKLGECRRFFGELYHLICREQMALEEKKGYSATVKKALGYIHQHYREGISLVEAAECAGVNSSYLSKLFKDEVGIGFVEYLNDVRLERAKELMNQSDRKLIEIMDESGFYSYSNFFGLFKKKFGMTPKEYRKGQE